MAEVAAPDVGTPPTDTARTQFPHEEASRWTSETRSIGSLGLTFRTKAERAVYLTLDRRRRRPEIDHLAEGPDVPPSEVDPVVYRAEQKRRSMPSLSRSVYWEFAG